MLLPWGEVGHFVFPSRLGDSGGYRFLELMKMQKPDRKVAAGGLAGGVSMLIVWGIGAAGVEVPAEVAAAITTIVTFVTSYFVPAVAK